MTQLSKNVLQKAVTELNDFLDITPRIKTTLPEPKLAASILQAADLLIISEEEDEFKQLSKSTQKVITVLREEEEGEVPAADVPDTDEDGFEKEELLKPEKPSKKVADEEDEEEEAVPAPKQPATKPKAPSEQLIKKIINNKTEQ